MTTAPASAAPPHSPRGFADVLSQDDRTPFDEVFDFSAEGMAHPVLIAGDGPGVILMHELPGFVPEFWRLANWLRLAGFRVYAPALYDPPGSTLEELHMSVGRVGGMARACISRELRLFVKQGGSPISSWLRALSRHIHKDRGGHGVGVIGLCLTGNFAWSVAVDPSVAAAVAAEPSMPFNNPASLHVEPEEAEALKARRDLALKAYRFDGDPACRAARFSALERLLGERVETHVLPDEAQNPDGNPFPHAVLTKDLVAEDGQPTFEAAREVLDFMTKRLGV
ncbi:dienelactone hydrolase family protein [Maricaulaceae bacterium EIL42A08]|nr:dienelactone hydrolase family protein [Maricaulaceae bacterium EIL42A08]